MPFDRLCQTVDKWAGMRTGQDIFMQIGATTWRPKNSAYAQMLDPNGYAERIKESSVLVMHAGIGSILAAMQHEKPIIVMPRRAKLRETRNDHQVATARMFTKLGGISVASDEDELLDRLDSLDAVAKPSPLSPTASSELIEAIRSFIHSDD